MGDGEEMKENVSSDNIYFMQDKEEIA